MAESNYGPLPKRGAEHDLLEVFVGDWRAEGTSFGSGRPLSWSSTETTRWHDGRFFLVQDERAMTGDGTLITHAIIAWDAEAKHFVSDTIENHGFRRRYVLRNEGRVWTLTGDLERARIAFSEDESTQTVTWEWRPKGDAWVPLCERINRRVV